MRVKCVAGLFDPKTSIVCIQNTVYDLPADFVSRFPGYFEKAEETMQKAPENKMVTVEKETTKREEKEERKPEKKKAVKKSG